mgnify:FL=1
MMLVAQRSWFTIKIPLRVSLRHVAQCHDYFEVYQRDEVFLSCVGLSKQQQQGSRNGAQGMKPENGQRPH